MGKIRGFYLSRKTANSPQGEFAGSQNLFLKIALTFLRHIMFLKSSFL
jgi:hypothetical protein